MEFSLSSDRYGNSSCTLRELDLYYSPVKWSWSLTFLFADLNYLMQIEKFMVFLYSFHCSRVKRFMKILLAGCCLQIAATRTWSKNFPIFTWSGSKYFPSLHFTQMQFPHGTWFWYCVVKYFDDDGSHELCLHNMLLKSA